MANTDAFLALTVTPTGTFAFTQIAFFLWSAYKKTLKQIKTRKLSIFTIPFSMVTYDSKQTLDLIGVWGSEASSVSDVMFS